MMEVRDGLYIVHVTDNKVDFIKFIPSENTLERVFIDIAEEREKKESEKNV